MSISESFPQRTPPAASYPPSPPGDDTRPRVVLKFGGTSVRDRTAWERIETLLRERTHERILVVHSALPGATDTLERLAAGGAEPGTFEAFAERHRALARDLLGAPTYALEEALSALAARLASLHPGGECREPGPERWSLEAEVLATGERLSTLLGAAWLAERGLPVSWLDVRELLRTGSPGAPPTDPRHWLSAECDAALHGEVRARLDALDGIGLTQGFTAAGPGGETVVLGRGGSDTAAACLAGRWGADRLELWSDVPGMFTADPHRIPAARILRRLSYAEGQEIATTGSRVLHPRCIPALRERRIPIHLRSTRMPDDPGTVIEPGGPEGAAQLKAISWKGDVVLVSMETLGMWQEVGFLARAFEAFRAVGLSVDLVSTSETNVTVSLDSAANLLDPARLAELGKRLSAFCRVEVIRPCAAVSLVGNRIRGMLHRLAPALQLFEEHRIHLVSQAASDLNFTVVVDEDQGERLARALHRLLVAEPGAPGVFGPSWSELVGDAGPEAPPAWWEGRRAALLEAMEGRDAAYVYDPDTVRARLAELTGLGSVSRVFYAMKANPHPALLAVVREGGAGFECVSRGEVERVLDLFPRIERSEILFTPNFASRDELAFGLEAGVRVTLDALHPLEHWGDLFAGQEVFVRLDPGEGAGHHEKVTTAGLRSKFGVHPSDLPELEHLVRAAGARVTGLHVHAGSGILTAEHWARMGRFLGSIAPRFPDVRVLDLGGGLPVPQSRAEPRLDLRALDRGLTDAREGWPGLELWLEPGRYLVAEAGVLLARVTQLKGKGHIRYVGLATGMNSLIRPALYGSYHEIVNLTRLGEPATERVQVVGPICETGDRLGVDRLLPVTREGEVLLIAAAGAYGRAMASEYNLRQPAEEVVLAGAGVNPGRPG